MLYFEMWCVRKSSINLLTLIYRQIDFYIFILIFKGGKARAVLGKKSQKFRCVREQSSPWHLYRATSKQLANFFFFEWFELQFMTLGRIIYFFLKKENAIKAFLRSQRMGWLQDFVTSLKIQMKCLQQKDLQHSTDRSASVRSKTLFTCKDHCHYAICCSLIKDPPRSKGVQAHITNSCQCSSKDLPALIPKHIP